MDTTPSFLFFLTEIPRDLRHAAFLPDGKGTAALAVTAMQASLGIHGKLCIVIGRDRIPCQGEIVILVDKADVDPRGARLTVVAVDTGPLYGIGRKAADDRIVTLGLACRKESEKAIKVRHRLHAGNGHEHPGAVKGILQALVFGKRLPEGGSLGREELPRKEGLHHADAHPLALTAPE